MAKRKRSTMSMRPLKPSWILANAVLHLMADWDANVGSQEEPGLVDEFLYGQGFDEAINLLGARIQELKYLDDHS